MKAKYIVIFFLSLLSFVACDKEEVVIPTTAPRTVLIYFAGDNSLSGYVSQNLRAIKEGIERDGLNNGNLLIYTDKQNEAPQLFQLKLEADTIRQIVLETYDSNQNSASTETLTQIIDKVQKEYPADSYGLGCGVTEQDGCLLISIVICVPSGKTGKIISWRSMIWPPLYRSIILILFCSTLVICRVPR